MKNSHLNFLKDLNLSSGESWRGDCFNCGNKNTLSVRNELGSLIYYCFHTDCDVSGNEQGDMSYGDIREFLHGCTAGLHDTSLSSTLYNHPDFFVEGYTRPAVLSYLRRFNSIDPYADKRIQVKYDPKQNRLVFLLTHNGECYGAIGRGLHHDIKPKWYVYHNDAQVPFICPVSNDDRAGNRVGVLVEDCLSACSVSHVANGIALLGTNVPDAYIKYIRAYDSVVIALDKDASSKAIDLHRQLSIYCKNVSVKLLEQDLKYLDRKEIKKCLEYWLKT